MQVEKAKEIHSSTLWNEVCLEIDSLIKIEEVKLRSCQEQDLRIIQAIIAVYERIKRLPQTVIDREE